MGDRRPWQVKGPGAHSQWMLGPVLDVFRLRQYFNVITRTREWVAGLRDDAGFLTDAARAVVRVPSGAAGVRDLHPFPPTAPYATRLGRING